MDINYFLLFEAGNCISNSNFRWQKVQLKKISMTEVNIKQKAYCTLVSRSFV